MSSTALKTAPSPSRVTAYRKLRYEFLHHAGILNWWKKRHRFDISILMLHGTGNPEAKAQWRPLRVQTAPDELERAIVRLKAHGHHFISLDHAVQIIDGKADPVEHGVVLTFDDGYRSNLTHAVPVLRKHNVPGIFFVVCRNAEKREPLWFDRVDYAIQHAQGDDIRVRSNGLECVLSNSTDRRQVYAQLRYEAKRSLRDDRHMQAAMSDIAEQLERLCPVRLQDIFENDPWSALMNKDEIRALAADPLFDIGSHTLDHYRLDVLDNEERQRQVKLSREWIENVTGRPCKYLCFPNGNFNPEAVRSTMWAGYYAALSNEEGLNRIANCGFAMQRLNFPAFANDSELLVKASGLWAQISKFSGKQNGL